MDFVQSHLHILYAVLRGAFYAVNECNKTLVGTLHVVNIDVLLPVATRLVHDGTHLMNIRRVLAEEVAQLLDSVKAVQGVIEECISHGVVPDVIDVGGLTVTD